MKILFEIGLSPHIRHYDNVIEELKKRHHKVEIWKSLENSQLFEKRTIEQDHRNVMTNMVFLERGQSGELSYLLRCCRDYIRFLQPQYDSSSVLRGRIRNMLKFGLTRPFEEAGKKFEQFIDGLPGEKRQEFSRLLGSIDNALPSSEKIEKQITRYKPDLLLITPLIFTQYGQFELVKCAKKLEIPVGYMVFSWDNISTKGVIHYEPNAIFLWNEIQKSEIIKEYSFPKSKIFTCGAPRFDYFFSKKPSMSKEEFLKSNNLDPDRSTVTYLCSSNLISNSETDFISAWLSALEADKDDRLKKCNVIIRPHPKFKSIWENFDFSKFHRRIAVCASERLNNDQLLFDVLYFSEAVIGLNTSAQLEAAVLSKPVLTIQVPEYQDGQSGTIHYHYLLKENGGFVLQAQGLDMHCSQLSDVLNNRFDKEIIRKFVTMFIRPNGLDKPAAISTADAIEMFYASIPSSPR